MVPCGCHSISYIPYARNETRLGRLHLMWPHEAMAIDEASVRKWPLFEIENSDRCDMTTLKNLRAHCKYLITSETKAQACVAKL